MSFRYEVIMMVRFSSYLLAKLPDDMTAEELNRLIKELTERGLDVRVEARPDPEKERDVVKYLTPVEEFLTIYESL